MTEKIKNPHAQALGHLGGAARRAWSAEARQAAASKAGKAGGWPKGKPRGPRKPPEQAVSATGPYAIIYGAEGADFPKVFEDGPYDTFDDAKAGIDQAVAAKLGGWMIVAGWAASDGNSITTGKGQVLEVSK